MNPTLESPFFTTQEAARFLRLDARTLDNMRWRNNGPRYRKHGGKVFYHIDDLNYWSSMRDCGSGPRIEFTQTEPEASLKGAEKT